MKEQQTENPLNEMIAEGEEEAHTKTQKLFIQRTQQKKESSIGKRLFIASILVLLLINGALFLFFQSKNESSLEQDAAEAERQAFFPGVDFSTEP